MKRMLVAATVAAAAAGTWTFVRTPDQIELAPGDSLRAAIQAAPEGAVVHLLAGDHEGGVRIGKRLVIEGAPGARVVAAGDQVGLIVGADGVAIRDLEVAGGSEGISIREAEGVTLEDVTIRDADLHGIEVVDASATITRAFVADLRSPYAQGIEIRYADNHPASVVQDSRIVGGQEGLVSHVSRVRFRDNVVSRTSIRAISITEMSHGVARRNHVHDAEGSGLYCGDMSMCEFSDNRVDTVARGGRGFGPEAGWGLAVNYESRASSHGDDLDGEAGAIGTFAGSALRDRSPLELGAGVGAVPAIVAATGVALVLLLGALGAVAFAPRFAPRRASGRTATQIGRQLFVTLVWAGVAIQTFHMGEHVVQVFRVRVDGVPSRGGLVGSVIDTEWVHFVYNALVLVGLVVLIRWGRRVDAEVRHRPWAERLAGAALLIQSYHVVEHTAKISQHLATGRKVNEGLLGGPIDLVMLHYTINMAVYFGIIAACVLYLRGMRVREPAPSGALHTSDSRGRLPG